MDKGTLLGIATIFAFVAFIGVCLWAYSSKRREAFEEAANLPFADEADEEHSGRGRASDQGKQA